MSTAKEFEMIAARTLARWIAEGTEDAAALSVTLRGIFADLSTVGFAISSRPFVFVFADGSIYDANTDLAI